MMSNPVLVGYNVNATSLAVDIYLYVYVLTLTASEALLFAGKPSSTRGIIFYRPYGETLLQGALSAYTVPRTLVAV